MSSGNVAWEAADTAGVWIGEARHPGPTVAIFGGVHGDEQTGIEVVKQSLDRLAIDQGTVILALGNLAAIEANKRFVEVNLNRQFKPVTPELREIEHSQWPSEVRRAQELLPYLKESDALLDLHDFSNPKGPVFMITEPRGLRTARAIGAPVISTGWSTAEPGGSDGYMETIGRVGICYELGYKRNAAANLERGHGAVDRFLQAQGLVEGSLAPMYSHPRHIRNERAYIRRTPAYRYYLGDALTFDPIPAGKAIAHLDGETIRAEEGDVIIFPGKAKDTPIGTEAFSIGRILSPSEVRELAA